MHVPRTVYILLHWCVNTNVRRIFKEKKELTNENNTVTERTFLARHTVVVPYDDPLAEDQRVSQ